MTRLAVRANPSARYMSAVLNAVRYSRQLNAAVKAGRMAGSVAKKVMTGVKRSYDRMNEGNAQNSVVKAPTKKRKAFKSKQSRKSSGRKRKLVKLIKKTVHGENPGGRYVSLNGVVATPGAYGQLVQQQDKDGNQLGFCPFKMLNAAGVLYNNGVDTPAISTSNFFLTDVPIVIKKQHLVYRFQNTGRVGYEVDMYVFTPKINSANDVLTAWAAASAAVKFTATVTSGYTGTALPPQSFYCYPGEFPKMRENWSWTHKTIQVPPGAYIQEFMKGRTGTFLPARYGPDSSTVGTPTYFNNVKDGWTKAVVFVVRAHLAVNNVNFGPKFQTSEQLDGLVIHEHYTCNIEAPEGTAVADRVEHVHHSVFLSVKPNGSNDSSTAFENPISRVLT